MLINFEPGLILTDPHYYQLDHNTRVYFTIALLINKGGISGWIVLVKCLESGEREGCQRKCLREMSWYRPGMAQEKSGHPQW